MLPPYQTLAVAVSRYQYLAEAAIESRLVGVHVDDVNGLEVVDIQHQHVLLPPQSTLRSRKLSKARQAVSKTRTRYGMQACPYVEVQRQEDAGGEPCQGRNANPVLVGSANGRTVQLTFAVKQGTDKPQALAPREGQDRDARSLSRLREGPAAAKSGVRACMKPKQQIRAARVERPSNAGGERTSLAGPCPGRPLELQTASPRQPSWA